MVLATCTEERLFFYCGTCSCFETDCLELRLQNVQAGAQAPDSEAEAFPGAGRSMTLARPLERLCRYDVAQQKTVSPEKTVIPRGKLR